jgi:hypothetical protein
MRDVLIAAAALVALAGPAQAAKVKMPNGSAKHTWFMLHYDTATCETSPLTPQEFQNSASGFLGHESGITAERITPDDVLKYNDGTLKVTVRGTTNGSPGKWDFFSSKEMCSAWLTGIKPQQAPSSDIN